MQTGKLNLRPSPVTPPVCISLMHPPVIPIMFRLSVVTLSRYRYSYLIGYRSCLTGRCTIGDPYIISLPSLYLAST